MVGELHTPGLPPRILELGAVLQVLHQGRQRPLVCSLEEAGRPAGLWVVKPFFAGRGRGSHGQLMALCELAGSEVCAYAGLGTPAIGLMRLPAEPVDLSALEESDRDSVKHMLLANRGQLAFCSRRLDTAVDAEPSVLDRPRRRTLSRTAGFTMLLVDALLRNVDRRLANPNALLWHGDLIAIDHGQAFDGIEHAEDPRVLARSPSLAFNPHEHLLVEILRRPSKLELDSTAFRGVERFRTELINVALRWPDELDGIAGGGQAYKTRLSVFLDERLARTSRVIDSVLQILKS